MKTETPAIEIRNLVHRYGKTDAVNGLSLRVMPGRCYGFFGRNGAGKTTTIRCLLNLLKPNDGSVRVFGLDPHADEVAVKRRIAYVPDAVAFYPWMSVRGVLEYLASFRDKWEEKTERELLDRFRLDERKKVSGLSKGQRTQLALIGAICAGPDMLVLDEPTSGLDPIVRREFIETVIGAYQEAAPGQRTVFVSTHLITEFEGLIDEFTIIENGRDVLSLEADVARANFQRIRTRFTGAIPDLKFPEAVKSRQEGRDLELVIRGNPQSALAQLKALQPEALTMEALTLEEIFVACLQQQPAIQQAA